METPMIKFLLLLFGLAASLNATAAGTDNDWLANGKAARVQAPAYAFEFESVSCARSVPASDRSPAPDPVDWASRPPISKTTGRLAVSPGRVALSMTLNGLKNGTSKLWNNQSVLWDGKRQWSCQLLPAAGMNLAAYTVFDSDDPTALLAQEQCGGFLDGHVLQLPVPDWLAAIEQSSRVETSSSTQLISGFECRVIQGRVKNIDYQLWVDESHGFNLRQAKFSILMPPPAGLKRFLPGHKEEAPQRVELWIQDVKVQDQAPFFPLSGVLLSKTTMNTGNVYYQKQSVQRKNVQIGIPTQGWKASGFPDDVLVTDLKTGIINLWQSGKLTPFVDGESRQRADDALRQVALLTSTGALNLAPDFRPRATGPTATSAAGSVLVAAAVPAASAVTDASTTRPQHLLADFPLLDPVGQQSDLYCLSFALDLCDRSVEMASLLKPEFVGDPLVYPPQKLMLAAKSNGLAPALFSRLDTSILKKMTAPFLLHTKSSPATKRYDSNELYLGTRADKALLFNPQKGLQQESFVSLNSRWDGTGVLLSLKPVGRGRILATIGFHYALIVLLSLVVSASAWFSLRRWMNRRLSSHPLWGSAGEFAALIAVAMGVALMWHGLRAEGFLSHADATDYVRDARMGLFLPPASLSDVAAVVAGKARATILDARDGESYLAGHIPGAINVTIEGCADYRRELMSRVSKNDRIIVYCVSEDCGIARRMVAFLYTEGYRNLQVYPGGWKEWEKIQGSTSQGH